MDNTYQSLLLTLKETREELLTWIKNCSLSLDDKAMLFNLLTTHMIYLCIVIEHLQEEVKSNIGETISLNWILIMKRYVLYIPSHYDEERDMNQYIVGVWGTNQKWISFTKAWGKEAAIKITNKIKRRLKNLGYSIA